MASVVGTACKARHGYGSKSHTTECISSTTDCLTWRDYLEAVTTGLDGQGAGRADLPHQCLRYTQQDKAGFAVKDQGG